MALTSGVQRIERVAGAGFADLLECLTSTVRADLSSVNGALVEPKRSSVVAIAAWSTRPSGRASPGPSSLSWLPVRTR